MRLKETYNAYEKNMLMSEKPIQFMPYIFNENDEFFNNIRGIYNGYYLHSNSKFVSPLFKDYFNFTSYLEIVNNIPTEFENFGGLYGTSINFDSFLSFTVGDYDDTVFVDIYDENNKLVRRKYVTFEIGLKYTKDDIFNIAGVKPSRFDIILIDEGSYDKDVSIDYKDVFSSFIINGNYKLLGQLIRSTFLDKWKKDYSSLLEQYSPINDFNKTETITYGKTLTKNDSDTISFDGRKDIDSRTYNNLKEDRSSTDTDSTWTFNSINSQDTDRTTSTGSNTTSGGYTDERSKVGTEVRIKEMSDVSSGIDTKTIEGYNNNPTDNIQKALDFRAKNIFYNIIYKDIDSLITLQIY